MRGKCSSMAGMSIARDKVKKRREAGLCGSCGKNPCECLMPARKQRNNPAPTPDANRKKRGALRNGRKKMTPTQFREWFLRSSKDWVS
jgi:hypothetical protein